eukprot:2083141-Prymnesium_polylepis.1
MLLRISFVLLTLVLEDVQDELAHIGRLLKAQRTDHALDLVPLCHRLLELLGEDDVRLLLRIGGRQVAVAEDLLACAVDRRVLAEARQPLALGRRQLDLHVAESVRRARVERVAQRVEVTLPDAGAVSEIAGHHSW